MLAVLTVNVNTDGSVEDDGSLSIREAIAYANGTTPQVLDSAQINETVDDLGTNDIIIFDDGLFTNDEVTIKLTQAHDPSLTDRSGLKIAVQNSLVITAGAGRRVTITMGRYEDAPPVFGRVLDITGTAEEITLENLTFTGGVAGPEPVQSTDYETGSGGGLRGARLLISEVLNTAASIKILLDMPRWQ